MGQKINPTGFRLAVNRDWASKWYANSKHFPTILNEDIKVRAYLKKKLAHASVGKITIERPAKNARITIRRAMKRAMQNAMRLGAQGIKIMSAGRLNGIEIARTEWYREGRVPLHTLRADIDYGLGEAKTNYGVIGIKVWVYKGEIMPKGADAQAAVAPATAPLSAAQPEAPAEPKRAKKPAPRPAGRRGPARPRPDGDRKAAPRKADAPAAPAPKTTVKKAKKIVK